MTILALLGHHGQYGRHAQRLVEAELKTERGSVFWNQNLRTQRTCNYFVLEMTPKEKDAIKANVSVKDKLIQVYIIPNWICIIRYS